MIATNNKSVFSTPTRISLHCYISYFWTEKKTAMAQLWALSQNVHKDLYCLDSLSSYMSLSGLHTSSTRGNVLSEQQWSCPCAELTGDLRAGISVSSRVFSRNTEDNKCAAWDS